MGDELKDYPPSVQLLQTLVEGAARLGAAGVKTIEISAAGGLTVTLGDGTLMKTPESTEQPLPVDADQMPALAGEEQGGADDAEEDDLDTAHLAE